MITNIVWSVVYSCGKKVICYSCCKKVVLSRDVYNLPGLIHHKTLLVSLPCLCSRERLRLFFGCFPPAQEEIFFPLMLLWVSILFWTSWRRNIPLRPPSTMPLWLIMSFLYQKLAIKWYLKDSMEQLFVIPASKLKGQQVYPALMLLVGGVCVPPSSLLQLTYVVHLHLSPSRFLLLMLILKAFPLFQSVALLLSIRTQAYVPSALERWVAISFQKPSYRW